MPKKLTNKQELIDKAINVFLKNGYYNSSISDLARACDIEKSHFYYYFKDKRDLMNQCLIAFSLQIQKNVFEVSKDETVEASVRLKKMLDYIWSLYTDNNHGCFFGNTLLETVGNEPYFEETIREFFENWKNALMYLYILKGTKGNLEEMVLDDIEKIQGSIMLMKLYKDQSLLQKAIDQIFTKFNLKD
ncbi:DNA-binding transcriptional repressor AcrR [compost metagenome]